MTQSFVTAPSPLWTPNNLQGLPLRNGYFNAFQSVDKNTPKNVYRDAAGGDPYPPKIPFGDAAQNGPFYFEVNDPSLATDVYYLVFYTVDGNEVFQVDGFQPSGGGGGAPITVNQDFNNLTPNGQFRWVHQTSISNAPTDAEVAFGGWQFVKTNDSATDEVKFNKVPLGTANPSNTPVNEFEYECTIAGSGETEKFLEIRLKDVRTLDGQSFHIGFEATYGTGLNEIEVTAYQFFGTGGSPSAPVETGIATAILGLTYQPFDFTSVIPSAGGKVLGTNEDDYLSLRFKIPRNQTGNWKMVNFQTTLGPNIVDFQYQSAPESIGDIFAPLPVGLTSVVPGVNSAGKMDWLSIFPIGGAIDWFTPIPPGNWLFMDGTSLLVADFPELFSVLDYRYGGAAANFNLPDLRGYFTRVVDGGAGRDPDVLTRTAAAGGTPSTVGSTQTDEFKSHTHDVVTGSFFGGTPLFDRPSRLTPSNVPTNATGGAETRSLNFYIHKIIKVK